MLQELSNESRRNGLKMNIAKTNVMVVDNTPINVNNVLIEKSPMLRVLSSTSHTKIERPTSGSGRGQSHRYNQHCETNEMVLGRVYQPPQRRPMDIACHHLETI